MNKLTFALLIFLSSFTGLTAQTDSIKPSTETKLYKNSAGIEHFSTTTLSLNYQRFIGKKNHFAIAAGYGTQIQYKYMLANI